MSKLFVLIAVVAPLLAANAATLHAESVRTALQTVLSGNPVINAEREKVNAIEEQRALARSGYMPNLSLSGDIGDQHQFTRTKTALGIHRQNDYYAPMGFAVRLSQPIFQGGRVIAAVDEADASIRAAHAAYHSVAQSVLLEAATTYIQVVRAKAIRRLRQSNVTRLQQQLDATRARHTAGIVTKTDVHLALSREQSARSEYAAATADLQAARAEYVRLVGHQPRNLFFPPPPKRLPARTLQAALHAGERDNPRIAAAIFAEQAAKYAIDRERAEFMPSISFEAAHDRRWSYSKTTKEMQTSSIKIRGSLPLYQGGAVRANLRKARATRRQRALETTAARNQIHSQIISSWSSLAAARNRMNSTRVQITAAGEALQGIRNEEKVGQRTVLDVLDAEQELLGAKVAMTRVRGDYFIAYYQLLAAIGHMN